MSRLLLAFDLDGTVVHQGQPISARLLGSIQQAEKLGHAITVITGRTEASAKPFLEQLRISVPYGTGQGARVSTREGKVLLEANLLPKTAHALIRHAQQHPDGLSELFMAVGDGTRFYVIDPDRQRSDGTHYWDWALKEGHELRALHTHTDEPVVKIAFHTPEDARGLRESIKRHFPTLNTYTWEQRFLEVTHPNAHKGAALEHIAAALGIAQANTVAFGDGDNDLSMLAWAGRGIAVGQAEAHHAGVGDETIAPPEEYGVADWIERHLLEVVAG